MRAVLLDTHAWAWSLYQSSRLSPKGRASLEEAKRVLVSPISFYEVAQRVRLGKWAEMEPFAHDLWRGAPRSAGRPDLWIGCTAIPSIASSPPRRSISPCRSSRPTRCSMAWSAASGKAAHARSS